MQYHLQHSTHSPSSLVCGLLAGEECNTRGAGWSELNLPNEDVCSIRAGPLPSRGGSREGLAPPGPHPRQPRPLLHPLNVDECMRDTSTSFSIVLVHVLANRYHVELSDLEWQNRLERS